MNFLYFKIKNFKGIEDITLNLSKSPKHNVYTLVGLNESGKTTILEAINFFNFKNESLYPVQLKGYNDIHELIPINKRDNFNGSISIEVKLELDEQDEHFLKQSSKKDAYIINEDVGSFTIKQIHEFKNSKYIAPAKTEIDIKVGGYNKKTKQQVTVPKKHIDTKVKDYLKNLIPSILYFPNFLFDFPNKIYLENYDNIDNKKHEFYRTIVQDILDSLENDLNIEGHILARVKSSQSYDKKGLESVLSKMSSKVSQVVFTAWDTIFGKKFSKKEININCDKDDSNRIYLEFKIKDTDSNYLISERSLGFRWFFVFLLFTQFRIYRKDKNKVLFLFDEPASNLHSSAQTLLLNSFTKLPKLIFTTHSHHLINPHWLENTYVVRNEGLSYEEDGNEDSYNSKMTRINISTYRDFASSHPNQTSYFQPILDVLDYVPSNLEYIDNAIIVEGKFDYYTLQYFNSIIFKNRKSNSIIPGNGVNSIDTILSLYIGWGKKFVAILDSDEAGYKERKKYIERFGDSFANSIITLNDVNKDWKNFELEKLISKNDQIKIQTSCYPDQSKYNKTVLNRALQELMLKKQEVTFEKETRDNFKQLLAYLDKAIK